MNNYLVDFPIKIEKHIHYVNNISQKTNENIEGNYFSLIINGTDINNQLDFTYKKQANLYYISSLLPNNANVCEIGFNAGHSSIIILTATENKNINYVIFDICEHSYLKPCLEYIKSIFTNTNINFIEGDSIKTIPQFIKNTKDVIFNYDLIHIDGGHTEDCISNDMKNANILLKIGGIIIIDDTNIKYINDIVDKYIKIGDYEEIIILNIDKHNLPHRIIKKII